MEFKNEYEENMYCNSNFDYTSRIYSEYIQSSYEIDEFLQENDNIRIRFYKDSLIVETGESSWKICFENNTKRLVLYHENVNWHEKYKKTRLETREYHLQSNKERSILGYLKSLVNHDEWRGNLRIQNNREEKRENKKRKSCKRKDLGGKYKRQNKIINIDQILAQENIEMDGSIVC